MDEQRCWAAVSGRDASQDGRFWYGVLTTGVYCRPSCASRLPLRKNVRFYETTAQAEAAGLRPCKRCRPQEATNGRTAAKMQALCRYIESHAQESLSLEALGKRVHLSPFHLQRQFKQTLGVSPRQYDDALRMKQLKRGLKRGDGVAAATFEAGYGSSSLTRPTRRM